MLTQRPWAAATSCLRRALLQKAQTSGMQQKRDRRALSSCCEWTEEALSVQRKVPYLPPLPHFSCESIFLLDCSEGVGLRYLFQHWRLPEVCVCVRVLKRECSV